MSPPAWRKKDEIREVILRELEATTKDAKDAKAEAEKAKKEGKK